MNYTDIICIFILTCIIIIIFFIDRSPVRSREGFASYNVMNMRPVGDDNEYIDTKFIRDEDAKKTEVYFFVNDKIPSPTPLVITCAPNAEGATAADGTDTTGAADTGASTDTTSTDTTGGAAADAAAAAAGEDIPGIDYTGTDYIDTGTGTGTGGAGATGSNKAQAVIPKSTTSLQYYYSFESDTLASGKLLKNMAINYADAVVSNATIVTNKSAPGQGPGCAFFDNSNIISSKSIDKNAQYIKCPVLNTANYTKGISIALWINPIKPSLPNTYYIVLCLGTSYTDNIYIGYNNEGLFYGINGKDCYTNGNLPSGKWTHVVWTITNDGTHTIYVNATSIGRPDSDTIPYLFNHKYPFYMGLNNAGISNGLVDYYNGYLDDVRIYNRVLSSSDVQSLYNKKDVV